MDLIEQVIALGAERCHGMPSAGRDVKLQDLCHTELTAKELRDAGELVEIENKVHPNGKIEITYKTTEAVPASMVRIDKETLFLGIAEAWIDVRYGCSEDKDGVRHAYYMNFFFDPPTEETEGSKRILEARKENDQIKQIKKFWKKDEDPDITDPYTIWAYEGKVGAKDFNRIYDLLSRVMTNMVFDGEKKSPDAKDFPEFLAKFESLEDAVNDMWILRF
jgi:hypothetical protein